MKAYTLTNIHTKWSVIILCGRINEIETKLADYYIEKEKADGVMLTIDHNSNYNTLLSVYYPEGCTRYEMKLDIADVVIQESPNDKS